MWPSLFPRLEIAERHKYLSKVIEYLKKSTFSQDPVVGAVVEVQQAEGMELKRAGASLPCPRPLGSYLAPSSDALEVMKEISL